MAKKPQRLSEPLPETLSVKVAPCPHCKTTEKKLRLYTDAMGDGFVSCPCGASFRASIPYRGRDAEGACLSAAQQRYLKALAEKFEIDTSEAWRAWNLLAAVRGWNLRAEKQPIDVRYRLTAHNPVNGRVFSEMDALVLPAAEKTTAVALEAYLNECQCLGAERGHIESVGQLLSRVRDYQTAEALCRKGATCETGGAWIDRKFQFLAAPIEGGSPPLDHTNAVLLCAKDLAVPAALRALVQATHGKRGQAETARQAQQMLENVVAFQAERGGGRLPDTGPEELKRTLT